MDELQAIERPALWPAHRAVAHLPGSLPMGGVVAHTSIHAFEQPASALALAPSKSRLCLKMPSSKFATWMIRVVAV